MNDVSYGKCSNCGRHLWTYSEAWTAMHEGCPKCGTYCNQSLTEDFVYAMRASWMVERKNV